MSRTDAANFIGTLLSRGRMRDGSKAYVAELVFTAADWQALEGIHDILTGVQAVADRTKSKQQWGR